MFKHAENTIAVNLKTLDFSPLSEFLVATTFQAHIVPTEGAGNPAM
jgi:hypothetical protein